MKSQSLQLTERDRKIIDFLRYQAFATSTQLKKYFFNNNGSSIRRLIELENAHYIESKTAKDFFARDNKFTKIITGPEITSRTKIYYLSKAFRRQVSETNRILKYDLCLHQILLNDVRIKLQNIIQNYELILNDPQLKQMTSVDAGRRKEFTPDLSFEGNEFKLAIEYERLIKSSNRYSQRFGFFQNSSYSHVLYVYSNEEILKTLLDLVGTNRKFAFAHYLNPELIFSNTWGYMEINSWIKKVQSVY